MTLWKYPILEIKKSPRSFRCSRCGKKVETHSIYFKTNYGRYCNHCIKHLPTVEEAKAKLERR